jgi:hypothetical protein
MVHVHLLRNDRLQVQLMKMVRTERLDWTIQSTFEFAVPS